MSHELSPPRPDAGDAPGQTPPETRRVRPFAWCVRRELWENRSLYVGPLVVAGVVLLANAIRMLTLPRRMQALAALAPDRQQAALALPYSLAATVIILTAYVVGVVYCLDALYAERRDRSILFWKSLPVSDLTTVLAKAAIPLGVLPLAAFTLGLLVQLAMLALSSLVLLASGGGVTTLWTQLPLVQMTGVMFYGLSVHALWHAPLYAWLLLASAWARRVPVLWALLPPLALGALERIAFQSTHVCGLLRYRLLGAMREAFALAPGEQDILRLSQLDPLRFLLSPGLWSGLLVAALFLAAAVRLRRMREPT